MTEYQYVYIVRLNCFRESNEDIYTIGSTVKELYKELSEYPPETELLEFMKVHDGDLAESTLIERFTDNYIQCLKYGVRYFKGELDSIRKDFRDIGLAYSR